MDEVRGLGRNFHGRLSAALNRKTVGLYQTLQLGSLKGGKTKGNGWQLDKKVGLISKYENGSKRAAFTYQQKEDQFQLSAQYCDIACD